MSPALAALTDAAARDGLFIAGTLPLLPKDGFDARFGVLALLAPDEPGFWPRLIAAPEWADGAPDPVDRWSARIIGALAGALGGAPAFPFGGPPYAPFLDWALRSGRAWASPVGPLVHDRAGLFISFRGAVALPGPAPDVHASRPCDTCPQPCRTACPIAALTPKGYDVPACKAFITGPAGHDCMSAGCIVRRACPVGAGRRLPEHSAYHMKTFLG